MYVYFLLACMLSYTPAGNKRQCMLQPSTVFKSVFTFTCMCMHASMFAYPLVHVRLFFSDSKQRVSSHVGLENPERPGTTSLARVSTLPSKRQH